MHRIRHLTTLAVSGMLAALPVCGHASVVGVLGNFDVINDTNTTAHGFEIELEGLHLADISSTFGGPGRPFPSGRGFDPATSVVRYGAPTIEEYVNGNVFGTRVTYSGLYDSVSNSWDYGTPSGSFITPGDNCWSGGGVGYGASTPCDHFGVSTTRNATATRYSWLLETATPGQLTNGVVTLPAPVWQVIPAAPNVPQQVVAQIRAPEPVEIPAAEPQFGEAVWVKVFTTEVEYEVELEALVGGNALIDQAKSNTEIEWQLLQVDPGNPDSGKLESGYGVPVGPDAASIVRRYEFYKYSGDYDPQSHEALVGSDSHPNHPDLAGYDPGAPIELGNYLGAQNAAANINVAAVVPEPESYAMMLAGLACIGAIAGRRNRP